ncbi:MAG: hypothetical protein WKF84_01705 [Pyrinomonadaceae bacterium]
MSSSAKVDREACEAITNSIARAFVQLIALSRLRDARVKSHEDVTFRKQKSFPNTAPELPTHAERRW